MEKKIEVYCNTKRFEGDDAVQTKLTLDFTQLTEADILDMAVDSAVIKWQSSVRRKKNESVPKIATYVVPKPGSRSAPQMSEEEMLKKLLEANGGSVDALMAKIKERIS